MQERLCKTWTDFQEQLRKIRDHYRIPDTKQRYASKNAILFRGQGGSSWPVHTTLERERITFAKRKKIPYENEDLLMYIVRSVESSKIIESLTNHRWELPNISNNKPYTDYSPSKLLYSVYEYLVHLRHHGYPSPLLDWSASPYVAAYFALSHMNEDDAAVYVFIESPTALKELCDEKSIIHVMNHEVRAHKRHFSQQAWYTVCTKLDKNRHTIDEHKNVFDLFSEKDHNQDLCIKLKLSNAMREEGLIDLNYHNINEYTLYQSEDSLIKSIAMRDFILDEYSRDWT